MTDERMFAAEAEANAKSKHMTQMAIGHGQWDEADSLPIMN